MATPDGKGFDRDRLTAVCSDVMMRAAAEAMKKYGVEFSDDNIRKITVAMREMIPSTLEEALGDAREAFECNMEQIAVTTALASFSVAGITAVKKTFNVGGAA